MKTNKFCGVLAVIFSAICLSSCSLFDGIVDAIFGPTPTVKGQHEDLTMIDDSSIGYKTLPLLDCNSGLNIKRNDLTTYFYEDKANPFISFDQLINAIFSNKGVHKTREGNTITYYREHLGKTFFVKFDPISEEITTNTYSFFFASNYEGSRYNAIESQLHVVQDDETITLSLKRYNINMFIFNNEIILPAYLANMMFFSTSHFHLIYNYQSFILYNGYFDDVNDYMLTRNADLNNQLFCDGIYGARTEEIELLFDYYYGLKSYKQINSAHSLIYGDEDIISNMKQNDPNKLDIAYEKLFLHSLQDGHTSLGFKSYYHDVEDESLAFMYPRQLSEHTKESVDMYNKLMADYESRGYSKDYIYFNGDTAFFKFDEFKFSYFDYLFDEKGDWLPDASEKSTFALFHNILSIINEEASSRNTRNIVIDLTTNGGGKIVAVPEALSFITDKPINFPMRNSLTNRYTIETYTVDNDLDNDFTDLDSYSNFNYYIAVSPFTFSAANHFAAVAKDMGIAKIIGQKSGGGMCTVGNLSLIDGSTVKYSSNEILSGYHYVEGKPFNVEDFYDIEGGVEVDIPISMDKIYDFEYVSNIIHSNN